MVVDTPTAEVAGRFLTWIGFQFGIPQVLHTIRQFLGAIDSSFTKDGSISNNASGNKYKNMMVGSGNMFDAV
jgi:hypothetical protein